MFIMPTITVSYILEQKHEKPLIIMTKYCGIWALIYNLIAFAWVS